MRRAGGTVAWWLLAGWCFLTACPGRVATPANNGAVMHTAETAPAETAPARAAGDGGPETVAAPSADVTDCGRYLAQVCSCALRLPKHRLLCEVTRKELERLGLQPAAAVEVLEENCRRAIHNFKCW